MTTVLPPNPDPVDPDPVDPDPAQPATGSFVEKHYYFDADADARVDNINQATESTIKPATTGTEKESYTTSKSDKAGYHLVTVVSTSDPQARFDAQGASTQGNYVAGKELSVTYLYAKDPVKGSFVEKHYYFDTEEAAKGGDVDTATSSTVSTPSEGTAKDTYTTGKHDKDGYHLVKVISGSETKPSFNDDGSPATGNYVPGKDLEVIYIYVKDPAPQPVDPSQPKEPTDPSQPSEPTDGDVPQGNVTPTAKETSEVKGKKLPFTGVSGIAGLLGIAAIVAGAAGVALARRKQN